MNENINEVSEKRTYVPDKTVYHTTLQRLIEDDNMMTTLIAIRLGCELGMTRLEIVNAKVNDLDRINRRGLSVEVAKRVRRGTTKKNGVKIPKFQMRQREIPVNSSLYQLLKAYVRGSGVYILQRERGDDDKPFHVDMINKMYDSAKIPWGTHKSRHYFKSQVWAWMIRNRRPDEAVLKELMGHKKDVHQSYGEYPWDYKLEIVDGTFQ